MNKLRSLAESIVRPTLNRYKLRSFVSELSNDKLLVESVVSGAALIEARTKTPRVAKYIDSMDISSFYGDDKSGKILEEISENPSLAIEKAQTDKEFQNAFLGYLSDSIDVYVSGMENKLNKVLAQNEFGIAGDAYGTVDNITDNISDQNLISFERSLRDNGEDLINSISDVLRDFLTALQNGNIDPAMIETLDDLDDYINKLVINGMRSGMHQARKPIVGKTEGYTGNDIHYIQIGRGKVNEQGQIVTRTRAKDSKNKDDQLAYELIKPYDTDKEFLDFLSKWKAGGDDVMQSVLVKDGKGPNWQHVGDYSTQSQKQDLPHWKSGKTSFVGGTGIERPVTQYKSKNYELDISEVTKPNLKETIKLDKEMAKTMDDFIYDNMSTEYDKFKNELKDIPKDEKREFVIDFLISSTEDYMRSNKYLPSFIDTQTPDKSPFWIEEEEKRFEDDVHIDEDARTSKEVLDLPNPTDADTRVNDIITTELDKLVDISKNIEGRIPKTVSGGKLPIKEMKLDENMKKYLETILLVLSEEHSNKGNMREIIISLLMNHGIELEEAKTLADELKTNSGYGNTSNGINKIIKDLPHNEMFKPLIQKLIDET
jgi:hypothetical protein